MDRTAFLKVKERLDHYRLSAPFPIDALPLLQQLLNRLDAANAHHALNRKDNNDSTFEHSRHFEELHEAIKAEMHRLLHENHELRHNLLLAHEENQCLRDQQQLQWERNTSEGTDGHGLRRLLEAQQRREGELREELEQARYKYNELMELIHEDPLFEKKYIRRLLKHRKMECDQLPLHDAKERLSEIEEIRANRGSRKDTQEVKAEVAALHAQLRNRELEIIRLQGVVEGTFLPYAEGSSFMALKRWRERESERREALLADEIERLGREKAAVEKELEMAKMGSGGKEGVGRKMDRMRGELQRAISSQQTLARHCQQQQFDLYIQDKELKRRSQNHKDTDAPTPAPSPPPPPHKDTKSKENNQWVAETRKSATKKTIREVVSDEKVKPKRSTSINREQKQSKGKPPINRIPLRSTAFTSASSPQSDPALLKQAYEKLLAEKNAYIKELQQSLKSQEERGPAQNINSGNTQTNNLVIKNHKNEYITFNNKSPEEEKLRKKVDRTNESLINTERERDRLAQRVRELQAELAQERQNASRERQEKETARQDLQQRELEVQQQKQKSREAEERESRMSLAEAERLKQLENANERLRIKLQETQNSLIQTNTDNLSLQKQLNHLLSSKSPQPNPPSTQENQQMKDVQNLNLQECWLQLIFLRREIKRLSTEVSILRYERDILQGKLRQTEKILTWQGTQMGHFEKRVIDETLSPLPKSTK